MTLVIPKTEENTGNRHHRRMLAARQRQLASYSKKMKAFYTKMAQKHAKK